MYTSKGQQLRSKLSQGVGNNVLLEMLRPIVQKIPQTVSERVKKTGQNADGGAFSTPYSQGWARVRRKNSRQTSYKDFNFTGSMWESLGITKEQSTDAGVYFEITPSGSNSDGTNNYTIADGHGKRENINIIAMNQDEIDEFTKDVVEVVKNYLTNVFR